MNEGDLSIFSSSYFCQSMVVLKKNLSFRVFQNTCIETSLVYRKAALLLLKIFE